MWAPHLVIHGSFRPPPRRAGGNVTAWLFGCRRGHRHGRAPWLGPNRGPVGRAAGSPARSVCAEPSAGGYGSAALFLTSGRPPILGADGGQPGPGGPALGGTVGRPAAVGRHSKVAAGWNVAAGRSVTRRCYTSRSGRCAGLTWPRRAAAAPPGLRLLVRRPGWCAAGRLPARR